MKKNNVTDGLIWSFAERITAQLISTIVTIILARILTPEHYGVVSIVSVFTTICNVFVTSGFGSAIVQKKEIDELDLNTAFFTNLAIAALIYLIIFAASPVIGSFYDMPELTAITRVMGLRILLASVNTIQQAVVRRQMAFKKFFWATLFGTLVSAVVGIAMALKGFGAWALVAQYLTNTTIDTLVMSVVGGWRPKLQFSFFRAKEIMSFGWKVLAADLVSTSGNELRSMLIGKVFGAEDLAYHDQGKKFPALLVNNIIAALNKVMLPVYSRSQEDIQRLKGMLRNSVQMGIFLLAPIMVGFACVADTFTTVVLTEKWLPCVPFIWIFCVSYLTRPIEASCHQALLAIGRGDIVLRIITSINIASIASALIAIFVFESVLLVAVGSLLTTMTSLLLFMYFSKKLIGYSTREQIADLAPALLVSAIMGGVVIFVKVLPLNALPQLCLQVVIGVIAYILLSLALKVPGSGNALVMIKHFIKKVLEHK